MSNSLLIRLEKLEREQPEARQRFVWINAGETEAQALEHVAPLQAGEAAVFFSWIGEGYSSKPALGGSASR